MIIFIEGPNGAGKTTLCNQLKDYGIDIVAPVPPEVIHADEEWQDTINTNELIVCDRSPLSELVYRLVDTKKISMRLSTIFELLDNHSDKAKIIFCNSDKAYERSQLAEKNHHIAKDTHKFISNTYVILEAMIKRFTKIPVLILNTTNEVDIKQVIKFILKGDINGV